MPGVSGGSSFLSKGFCGEYINKLTPATFTKIDFSKKSYSSRDINNYRYNPVDSSKLRLDSSVMKCIGYLRPSKKVSLRIQRLALLRQIKRIRGSVLLDTFQENNGRSNKQLNAAIKECFAKNAVLVIAAPRIPSRIWRSLVGSGIQGMTYCAPWHYKSAQASGSA